MKTARLTVRGRMKRVRADLELAAAIRRSQCLSRCDCDGPEQDEEDCDRCDHNIGRDILLDYITRALTMARPRR